MRRGLWLLAITIMFALLGISAGSCTKPQPPLKQASAARSEPPVTASP